MIRRGMRLIRLGMGWEMSRWGWGRHGKCGDQEAIEKYDVWVEKEVESANVSVV
jgi:hypothetical protein